MKIDIHEIIALGVKTFGDDKSSMDGIYQLNGVEYVVCGTSVTPRAELD